MEQLTKLLKLLIDLKELQARYVSEGTTSQDSAILKSVQDVEREILSQHYLPEVYFQINRLRQGIGTVYSKTYTVGYTDFRVDYIYTAQNDKIPGIELIAHLPQLYYFRQYYPCHDGATFQIYDGQKMELVTRNEWDTDFQKKFKEVKNIFLVVASAHPVTELFGGLLVGQSYFIAAKQPHNYLYYDDFFKKILDTNQK
jgi:hypothetical protein